MKNIEALVTDLETSKQMQEAGIDLGETAFVWVYNTSEKVKIVRLAGIIGKGENFCDKKTIPAFTTGELMQVLPKKIGEGKDTAFLEINFNNKNELQCGYLLFAPNGAIEDCLSGDMCFDKLPQQALAKLLLWCKKEGYL